MTDIELVPYAVFGLYRDRHVPAIVHADTPASASRVYHDRYPGLEGTVLQVKSVDDLIKIVPDGDT